MNGSGTLHSSVKQDWQTPDDVLDVVRQVGPIGLDPCTVAFVRAFEPHGVITQRVVP